MCEARQQCGRAEPAPVSGVLCVCVWLAHRLKEFPLVLVTALRHMASGLINVCYFTFAIHIGRFVFVSCSGCAHRGIIFHSDAQLLIFSECEPRISGDRSSKSRRNCCLSVTHETLLISLNFTLTVLSEH